MATHFRNFATDTIGVAAPGITLRRFGTGTGRVETSTGASGGRALRLIPQSGNRHVVAVVDAVAALAATNFEVQARIKFPAGADRYFKGAGVVARLDTPSAGEPSYAAGYNWEGFSGSNALLRYDSSTGGHTEIGVGNIQFPTADVWLRVLIRVIGTNIRAWFWLDSDTPKTNASTPDFEGTNATVAAGVDVGIFVDTASALAVDVDWIGTGTDGDAAPTSAASPATLSAPTPSGTLGTQTTATVGATTNQNTGTFFAVVGTGSQLTGVTATQIKAGQQASGAAALAAGSSAVSTTSPSVGLTGLVAGTTYTYAAIQNNANGDTNIVTGSFTTAAVARPRRRFGVPLRRPGFRVRP